MSLYVGNLPSEANAIDLERVFQKFGRCTIKMKDRYGFVVYENPSSAERALRTLRGARICGQTITLSWSNQQPHTSQRFGRGGKLYDPPRRRHYVNENADQQIIQNYRRGYRRGFEKLDGEVERHVSPLNDEPLDSYRQGEPKCHVVDRDETPVNDGSTAKVADTENLEDDRWEERVGDLSNENYDENCIDPDTYDSYLSDEKRLLGDRADAGADEPDTSTFHQEVDLGDKKRKRTRVESLDAHNFDAVKGPSSLIRSGHACSTSPLQQPDGNNPHRRREMIDTMNAHLFGEQLPVPNSHISMNPYDGAGVSCDELHTVLKHYGLPCPKENERQLPVELFLALAAYGLGK